WRDVTDSRASARTAVFCVIPRMGVGHTFPLLFSPKAPVDLALLTASLCSFAFDYCARQKVAGLHLTYNYLNQLPVVAPETFVELCPWTAGGQSFRDWLLPRILELTYTSWDLEAFAKDCGWPGPPFRWDEDRRFLLRCELDAAFLHLYLGPETEWREQPAAMTQAFSKPRDAVSYMLESFPIVKRKDEEKFNGDYRTKRVILEMYDEMAQAMATNQP